MADVLAHNRHQALQTAFLTKTINRLLGVAEVDEAVELKDWPALAIELDGEITEAKDAADTGCSVSSVELGRVQ